MSRVLTIQEPSKEAGPNQKFPGRGQTLQEESKEAGPNQEVKKNQTGGGTKHVYSGTTFNQSGTGNQQFQGGNYGPINIGVPAPRYSINSEAPHGSINSEVPRPKDARPKDAPPKDAK